MTGAPHDWPVQWIDGPRLDPAAALAVQVAAHGAVLADLVDGLILAALGLPAPRQVPAVFGLLSMPPARPRAPSLGVPGLGRVGRGKREKAGPVGPTMNCEGRKIRDLGRLRGGFGDGKSWGAGAAAAGDLLRNQWVAYPKSIFGESGETREGG